MRPQYVCQGQPSIQAGLDTESSREEEERDTQGHLNSYDTQIPQRLTVMGFCNQGKAKKPKALWGSIRFAMEMEYFLIERNQKTIQL